MDNFVDTLYSLLAVLTAALAGLVFYLGAPRQQLRSRPLPPRLCRLVGLGLTLASFALLRQGQQVGSALFSLLTLLMTVFIALPYLAALRQILKGPST